MIKFRYLLGLLIGALILVCSSCSSGSEPSSRTSFRGSRFDVQYQGVTYRFTFEGERHLLIETRVDAEHSQLLEWLGRRRPSPDGQSYYSREATKEAIHKYLDRRDIFNLVFNLSYDYDEQTGSVHFLLSPQATLESARELADRVHSLARDAEAYEKVYAEDLFNLLVELMDYIGLDGQVDEYGRYIRLFHSRSPYNEYKLR